MLLGTILISTQCKRESDGIIPKYLPLKDTKIVTSLEQNIQSITIKPIDSTMLLSEVSKFALYNGNYYVSDLRNRVASIDSSGALNFYVGQKGRGPEEFLSIDDFYIQEDTVVILDQGASILKYRADSGQFIKKSHFNLDQDICAIAPADGDNIYLFSSNPPDPSDFKEKFDALSIYNSKGEKERSILHRLDYVIGNGIFTQSYDGYYFMRPQEGDNILYKLINDTIQKYCEIDFGDQTVPAKYIFLESDLSTGFRKFLFSNYYKIPIYFQDTEDLLYFSCIGPEAKEYNFLMDKHSRKGIQWLGNSADGYMAYFMGSDHNSFYLIVSRGTLDLYSSGKISPDEMDPLKRFITDQMKGKDYPANTELWLVKIAFKVN